MAQPGRRGLSDLGRQNGRRSTVTEFRPERKGRAQKASPAAETHAENFYYLKQMNARTPMVLVLGDGEQLRGCIEWYDRDCLKINREGAPNVLVQKHAIKYMFKEADEN
jgi:sRNA-binding regulator protein Hfq